MIQEPVNSLELEKKILNTLMHDNEECDYMIARVEMSDFYFNNHKSIYKIIKEMRQAEYSIRPDTVYHYCLTKQSSINAKITLDTMLNFLMTEDCIPYQTKDTDIKLLREMGFQRKVKLLEKQ